MNKKSAMVIAVGLVAALLAGVAAVSLTLGGGGVTASASNEKSKPIVKTIEHTVTVHKQAKQSSQKPRIVVLPASSSSSVGSSTASYSDDGYEGSDGEGGGGGGGFDD